MKPMPAIPAFVIAAALVTMLGSACGTLDGSAAAVLPPTPVTDFFRATADSWVDSYDPTSTDGGTTEWLMVTDSGYDVTYLNRTFLKFDLSSIPTDSTIVEATVDLFNWSYDDDGADIGIYQVMDDWTEAALSWDTQPPIAQAAEDVVTLESYNMYVSWDVTGLVARWLEDAAPNYGVALKATPELVPAGGPNVMRWFDSRERTDKWRPPTLVVRYYPGTSEDCDDGIDNDGDTKVDCDDSNCGGDPACVEAEDCDDGIDNDGDGDVDCDDSDCVGDPACPEPEICDDRIDNDGDTKVDCADPDCAGNAACKEVCNDGKDNDGDTLVDCDDADCEGDPACHEPGGLTFSWSAPSTAEMGKPYYVVLTVRNTTNDTQPVSVALTSNPRKADQKECPARSSWSTDCRTLFYYYEESEGTMSVKLHVPPGDNHYSFGVVNKWTWIQPWDWTRIAAIVAEILFSWADIELAPLTPGTMTTLLTYIPHVGDVTYTYDAVADSQSSSWEIDVSVPWEKDALLWESVIAGVLASKATAAGFLHCGVPCFVGEAALIVTGETAYVAAADPEEEYADVTVGASIPIPEGCGIEDPAARDVARSSLDLVASANALETSYARHGAAEAAGDADWSAVQASLTHRYGVRAAQAARDLSDLIGPILDHVATPTDEELEGIRGQIADGGIPEVEECMLRALGYTDEQISEVSDTVGNVPGEAFQYFPDLPEALDVWAANMGVFSDALPADAETLTPLVRGWNQVCYVGEEERIDQALANVAGDVQAVYRLSSQQAFDRWFPGRPEVSTIQTLSPGDSLFVLMGGTLGWAQGASGSLPTSASLVQGWNTVCYTGPTKNASAATEDIAGLFAVAYLLRPDQSWEQFIAGRQDISNLTFLDNDSPVLVLVTQQGSTVWTFDP
jgi:hypothetical protein